MTSEWDGTAWGGTAVARTEFTVPRDGMAMVKAATGWQAFYNGVNQPLRAVNQSPSAMMREAQRLYHVHPWIRRAESTVTSKVANLPWHLEDENDDEVDDETTNPALDSIQKLLEKPQAALPPEERQPGLTTWRGLISITSRHMGLCGPSYWFLDQMDQGGVPLALLYLNPARITPAVNPNGNLLGYKLDADDYGNDGTPLRLDQVLAFYLDVPDFGAETTGLVAAAALKAKIVTASDVHVLSVLGTGGRIAGLVSPKAGYIDDDEKFASMERDFRNVNEAPDAAKRMTIIRGAMDFTQTGANPEQLGLAELGAAGRNDILAVWGVPPSQAGVPEARGLNSGESGKHEYEVLMTGPVHDRVQAIWEPIQYELLDRWKAIGVSPELEIEEPEFDDQAPAYAIAQAAVGLPLTNNQRLALVGMEPLPDYGPDGEPLGTAIVLPSTYTTWAQGAEDKSTPDNPFPNAPKPKPAPVPPPLNLGTLQPPPPPQIGPGIPGLPAKAGGLTGLRASVDKRIVPTIRRAMEKFLAEQRSDIAARIRNATLRQLKDEEFWFRGDAWDKALARTLKPHVAGIAEVVTKRTNELFTAKAKPTKKQAAAAEATDLDPFVAEVERFVVAQTGLRIAGINGTTRDAVGAIIRSGVEQGITASAMADAIEQLPAFDEARAELVARTESMFAYNNATLSSFDQYGVTEVEAIDGDYDETCAERNGQVFSVEDAFAIEDHPNGTLDWLPIYAKADPMMEVAQAIIALSEREPVINVNLPDNIVNLPKSQPVVKVTMPDSPPVVNVTVEQPKAKRIVRDEQQRIVGLE